MVLQDSHTVVFPFLRLKKRSLRIRYELLHENAHEDVVGCNFHFSETFCHCPCNCSTLPKMHLLFLLHIAFCKLYILRYISNYLFNR